MGLLFAKKLEGGDLFFCLLIKLEINYTTQQIDGDFIDLEEGLHDS